MLKNHTRKAKDLMGKNILPNSTAKRSITNRKVWKLNEDPKNSIVRSYNFTNWQHVYLNNPPCNIVGHRV